MGLPTKDKVNHFLAYDGWENVYSLCELEEYVRQTDSEVWGPRWTLGVQSDKVKQMHNLGKLVVPWTLDEEQFIKQFINEGDFDGMISNFSPLVAYFYYVQN